MIHKTCYNILTNKLHKFIILSKRCSALFINGPKATENFVFITPYVDYQEYFKQKDVVRIELNKRHVNVELSKLENLWSVYEDLNNRKLEYDKKKDVVGKQLGEFIKDKKEGKDVEKLKIQLNLLKDNIKKLKVPLWSAEEAAMLEFLKLPNRLHNLTPDKTNKILYEHGSQTFNNKNHLDVGKKRKLIHFTKNENYYLQGDAAIFELGAKFFFSKLLKQNDYTQFSNPDFTKSLVIEGCGEDHTNSDSTFILHHNEDTKVNIDNRLHLTGSSSIYSFFAYHAKHVLHNKVFPLKYFSMGRQYVPSPADEDSLFHVSQSSAVQLFMVIQDKLELDKSLNEVVDMTKNIYNQLGYHYRLSLVPAHKLKMWESLRLAVEMYSNSLKSYVEVGNISLSGDFISKRLMLTYTEEKQSKFPHIMSGTILNVPKLLACILEQDNDFVIPEIFKVENWCIQNNTKC